MTIYALRLFAVGSLAIFFALRGWEYCVEWLIFVFIITLFWGHPVAGKRS